MTTYRSDGSHLYCGRLVVRDPFSRSATTIHLMYGEGSSFPRHQTRPTLSPYETYTYTERMEKSGNLEGRWIVGACMSCGRGGTTIRSTATKTDSLRRLSFTSYRYPGTGPLSDGNGPKGRVLSTGLYNHLTENFQVKVVVRPLGSHV